MLQRLHRETALHHRDANLHRLSIVNAAATSETSYRDYLLGIHGFEAPVEAAIATSELAGLLDVSARDHIGRLREDLRALGVRDLARPRCAGILPFHHAAEALGWAYVLERHTILHGVVERHLAYRLPELLAGAGRYLGAPARSASQRWGELGLAMDRVARRPSAADRIVAAAHAAFRAQRSWFAYPLLSRRVA